MTPTVYRRLLTLALVLVTLIGLVARSIGLRERVYWIDECWTLICLSGFTTSEMDDELASRGILTSSDIIEYQRLHGGIWQTIQQILRSTPEQTPFYFALCKLALLCFGDGYFISRIVSCVAGVSLIPLAYWLARELRTSHATALVFALLVAISPLYVNISQEARLYSFWAALIFLSSACLVRAVRVKSTPCWICYSIVLTLSLYTIVLSAVVIAAHFLYVLMSRPFDRTNLARLTWASGISILLFLPWLFEVSRNVDLGQLFLAQSSQSTGIISHLRVWLEAASYLVGDVMDHGGLPRAQLNDLCQGAVAIFSVLLLVYGAYRMARFGPAPARCFVFSSWMAVVVMLIVPDLLFGGGRSAAIRYLIPAIGLGGLMIALGLWAPPHGAYASRLVRLGVLVAVCLLSIVSLYVQSDQQVTWNRRGSAPDVARAEVINSAPNSLLLCERQGIMILPLSHLLNDDVRVLVFQPPLQTVPSGFGTYFYLSRVGTPRVATIADQSRWQPAIEIGALPTKLWRLSPPRDQPVGRQDRESGTL